MPRPMTQMPSSVDADPLAPMAGIQPDAARPVPTEGQGQERRRAGRMENLSPELIALMRKPTAEAMHSVALYDAPNFVLPDARHESMDINLLRMGRFALAFGVCAAGWIAAFKLMMMSWG